MESAESAESEMRIQKWDIRNTGLGIGIQNADKGL